MWLATQVAENPGQLHPAAQHDLLAAWTHESITRQQAECSWDRLVGAVRMEIDASKGYYVPVSSAPSAERALSWLLDGR